ncbi:hypothetical protein DFS34DRAFT_683365 [Phlyctochytrium arcticum]|nr:hypothetical protein DFS34DRAFT_683365 [Phlyctochytrium arcticum]
MTEEVFELTWADIRGKINEGAADYTGLIATSTGSATGIHHGARVDTGVANQGLFAIYTNLKDRSQEQLDDAGFADERQQGSARTAVARVLAEIGGLLSNKASLFLHEQAEKAKIEDTKEKQKGDQYEPSEGTDTFARTYGLPCAHKLCEFIRREDRIDAESITMPFWFLDEESISRKRVAPFDAPLVKGKNAKRRLTVGFEHEEKRLATTTTKGPQPRKCRKCGKYANHNKTTCGRNKTHTMPQTSDQNQTPSTSEEPEASSSQPSPTSLQEQQMHLLPHSRVKFFKVHSFRTQYWRTDRLFTTLMRRLITHTLRRLSFRIIISLSFKDLAITCINRVACMRDPSITTPNWNPPGNLSTTMPSMTTIDTIRMAVLMPMLNLLSSNIQWNTTGQYLSPLPSLQTTLPRRAYLNFYNPADIPTDYDNNAPGVYADDYDDNVPGIYADDYDDDVPGVYDDDLENDML